MKNIFVYALLGVTIAMGVAVVVISNLGELQVETAVTMLGIGLACVGVYLLSKKDEM